MSFGEGRLRAESRIIRHTHGVIRALLHKITGTSKEDGE